MLYTIVEKVKWGLYKYICNPLIKHELSQCGRDVIIGRRFAANPVKNISIGDHTSIGDGARFLCTRAPINIGSHVMFGPGVTIVTGDHRFDIVGKYMDEITDADKRPEDDIAVNIEDDVWIGANATILKGVTLSKGCIVAAGSLVNKSVPPYTIVGGGTSARN